MFLIFKQNKFKIILILLLSVIECKNFKLLKKSLCRNLIGLVFFSIRGCRVKSFGSVLEIQKIYFRTADTKAILKDVKIEISVRKIFLRWDKKISRLHIQSVNLILDRQFVEKSANTKKRSQCNDSLVRNLTLIINKFVYALGLRYPFTIHFSSVNICSSFFKTPYNLSLEILIQDDGKIDTNLALSIKSIVFKLSLSMLRFIDCGRKIECVANILFEKTNSKKKFFESNHLNFQIHIISGDKIELSGVLPDSFFDYNILSTTEFSIKNISFKIPITYNDLIFSILKDSFLDIDGNGFSIQLILDSEDPDLIRFSSILLLNGESFFKSFPFLKTCKIQEYKAEGELLLKIDYMTSISDLNKYYFACSIIEDTFTITDKSSFDLSYLTSRFQYKPHSLNDVFDVHIDLFEGNPNYLTIEEIPQKLIDTIIATEDPNFFKHNGIDPYFIGVAIATNILHKKFIKGAGTITMQLVRNLFLGHKKTLARKVEELLLAWLMEKHYRISKKRILEIYLNIIEFGQGVYGVHQAADFYFAKDVSKLTHFECLILSYIIPRPKYFLDAVLSKSHKLKTNLRTLLVSQGCIKKDNYCSPFFSEEKIIIQFSSNIGVLEI